jgi:integral membrane protein (TIGR00529 family)
LKRPLYQALLGGLLGLVLLFHISPRVWGTLIVKVFTNWASFSVLISLYLITYLQKMLEAKEQIKLAERDLDGMFHNRRVNTAGAPLFIGLLPSAAAMILCGSIVQNATAGYLAKKEQAFIASWFRHIPESFLPTYPAVLLMTNLAGVPLAQFIVAMLVPISGLALIGYFPYLKKLPQMPDTPKSQQRFRDALNLVKHLWTLLFILCLILVFKVQVVIAVCVTILLAAVVYRFKSRKLNTFVRSAFEMRLLGNTFLVLVFKEFLDYTHVLERLPTALAHLPIPTFFIFAVLFFLGGIISGSNGIIALGTPMAFAAMPTGGVALTVLLMCMAHGASQLSPTHVCLLVGSEYFQISFGDLVRQNLPAVLKFCGLAIVYYLVITLFI